LVVEVYVAGKVQYDHATAAVAVDRERLAIGRVEARYIEDCVILPVKVTGGAGALVNSERV
jgi:hypothetical protein